MRISDGSSDVCSSDLTRRVASGTFRRIMRDIMEMFPAVTTIAQTIQLSLSPVFMLAGIGAILNVLVARLARVVDRARALEMLQPPLELGRASVRERVCQSV